jgi:hypothetical protein
MTKTDGVSMRDLNSSIDAGLIVLTRDGRVLFRWRDIKAGLYQGEEDTDYSATVSNPCTASCIADAVGAIEFVSDLVH